MASLNSSTRLRTSPPEYVNPTTAAQVRAFKEYQKSRPSLDTIHERRIAAGTFFELIREISPADPNFPTKKAIAQGLGLERTVADTAKGKAINLLDDPETRQLVLSAYAEHLDYMEGFTHPTLLAARENLIKRGALPRINRMNSTLKEAFEQNRGITWDNLAWGNAERDPAINISDESTTNIRAQGMWTYLTHDKESPIVSLAVIGPSHPDLISPLALAELALIGSIAFVPCDATQARSDFGEEFQEEMIKATFEFIDNHPLLHTHQFADNYVPRTKKKVHQYLSEMAKSNVGVTLKPHPPEKAAEQAKKLYEKYGITKFRIFDPRDSSGLAKTTELVKKAVPNSTIFSGQVIGANSARSLYNAGSSILVLFIGDGGHCKTASGSGMAPVNPYELDRIQQEIADTNMGIIADGGLGSKNSLALLCGADAVMKHGSLLVGTVQQSPCFTVILDQETGEASILQSGEAAARTKIRAGMVNRLGHPKNVEGVDKDFDFFDGEPITFGQILEERFLSPMAKHVAFSQAESLIQLIQTPDPVVWTPTSEATLIAGPHV